MVYFKKLMALVTMLVLFVTSGALVGFSYFRVEANELEDDEQYQEYAETAYLDATDYEVDVDNQLIIFDDYILKYDYTDDSAAVKITGYEGNPVNVTIPEDVDRLPVTTIDSFVFLKCETLKSIDCQDVTTISRYAFEKCTALESIVCPYVTTIGNSAFYGCSALKYVVLSSCLESVDSDMFKGCSSLSDVYFYGTEDEWTSISGTIQEDDCLALITLHCIIADDDHFYCDTCHEIYYDDYTITYKYVKNHTEIEITGYEGKPTNVTIPDSIGDILVTYISENAFADCEIQVTIPTSITYIDDNAFSADSSIIYEGSAEDWEGVHRGKGIDDLAITFMVESTTTTTTTWYQTAAQQTTSTTTTTATEATTTTITTWYQTAAQQTTSTTTTTTITTEATTTTITTWYQTAAQQTTSTTTTTTTEATTTTTVPATWSCEQLTQTALSGSSLGVTYHINITGAIPTYGLMGALVLSDETYALFESCDITLGDVYPAENLTSRMRGNTLYFGIEPSTLTSSSLPATDNGSIIEINFFLPSEEKLIAIAYDYDMTIHYNVYGAFYDFPIEWSGENESYSYLNENDVDVFDTVTLEDGYIRVYVDEDAVDAYAEAQQTTSTEETTTTTAKTTTMTTTNTTTTTEKTTTATEVTTTTMTTAGTTTTTMMTTTTTTTTLTTAKTTAKTTATIVVNPSETTSTVDDSTPVVLFEGCTLGYNGGSHYTGQVKVTADHDVDDIAFGFSCGDGVTFDSTSSDSFAYLGDDDLWWAYASYASTKTAGDVLTYLNFSITLTDAQMEILEDGKEVRVYIYPTAKNYSGENAAALMGNFVVYENIIITPEVCPITISPNVEPEELIIDENSLGDIDGDGRVTAIDSYRCLVAYATANSSKDGKTGLTTEQEVYADVDKNGKIDAIDAYYMLVYYASQQVYDNVTWDDIISS